MSVEFKDNSREVLAQLEKNKIKALTAIGDAAVEITVDYLERKYGKPIRITGDLIRSISKNVRSSDDVVDIGSNLDYSVWVHEGTHKMTGRPYLKDAIMDNLDVYKQIAAEHLGEGFDGVTASFTAHGKTKSGEFTKTDKLF